MFKPKLNVSKLVIEKIKVASEIAGCATPEEFAEKVLTEEANRVIASTANKNKNVSDKEVEEITNQLKGLGYLE